MGYNTKDRKKHAVTARNQDISCEIADTESKTKQKPSEDQQNHTTTEGITFTQNNPDATDEPDPTPAESVQPRYNKVQHSTPANKQQTKGNAIEKQLFDLFDGSPLATSITEETTPQRQRDIAAAYSNRENQQRQKSTKRRETIRATKNLPHENTKNTKTRKLTAQDQTTQAPSLIVQLMKVRQKLHANVGPK
ncbi:unnamed protein product [Clavelina lepadiformis]|uniref:Uncharacterized protein n=1 Tax=Clavelina lepadiformis TaxID=159417 RepID=A0ABP0EZD1_CLALP